MPADSSLLEQCFARVVHEAGPLSGRCIDVAIASLQQAENQGREVAEREGLANAWWRLQQQRGALVAQYPDRLAQAFRQGDGGSSLSVPAPLSGSSFLALVDDNAVNESLEAVRLQQALMPVVEQALAMVDARMSSLIGLETVHVEKNPIRPSVFVRTLRDLMSERESDAPVRTLWLQHVAPPLARELCTLYERVALMLQNAHVQEAGYRIRLVADGAPSRPSPLAQEGPPEDDGETSASRWGSVSAAPAGTATPPAADFRMGDLAREQTPLRHEVMRAFLAGEGEAFDAPLDNGYYEQVRHELARVDGHAARPPLDEGAIERERTRYRDLPVVERPARQVHGASPLSAERWGVYAAPHERARVLLELKHQADQVSQAVGLDVVRKLVDQVARDPLLLAPVREAVVAMEPALLRLAMTEPRYFGQDDHPARRLIESVAQRSFRYNDEFATDFDAFFEPVRAQVAALNDAASPEPAPFAQALSSLQAHWSAADAEGEERQKRQRDALQLAEARQELANQIAWEISHRPDLYNVPGIVLDFLYGSWSLVIAGAQLSHPEAGEDPFGFRKVIGDLLWSTRREVTLRQPRQLFDIVPSMLQTLRRGLDMLGKPPEETQTFFDALLKLHEPALKLRRIRAQADHAGSSGRTPLDIGEGDDSTLHDTLLAAATPEQQKPQPPEQPWIGQRERASAGLDPMPVPGTEEAGVGDLSLAEGAETPAPMPPEALADLLSALQVGGWADLHSGGEWLRAQLVWVGTNRNLFLFTSRGGRSHTMTRRSCEKLLSGRWLRPVASRPVVKKALEAVVQAAPRGTPRHDAVALAD